MFRLNLPAYPIKLSGSKEQPTIFDVLRRRFVALTPEEWVRQHFIHYLIEHKNYPATLLANEVRLSLSGKQMRADSVLYNQHLQPVMIMEYKAPSVPITRKVFDQIMAYNILLKVEYLVVSNGMETYCCKMNKKIDKYCFIEELPNYENI